MSDTANSNSDNFHTFISFSPFLFVLLLGLAIVAGMEVKNLAIDASAESLLLENDPDLAYFREINKKYGSDDFLLVSFTPKHGVFSEPGLATLAELRDAFKQLPRVAQVQSILDVPLVASPQVPILELTKGLRTISNQNVDLELAKVELTQSPLYQDLLLSRDAETTALQIVFERDSQYFKLIDHRNALLMDENSDPKELESAIAAFTEYKNKATERDTQTINELREILAQYQGTGSFSIGGASMISTDIIDFISSDLRIFGSAIILFIILSLLVAFRQFTWVLIPVLSCLLNVIFVTGVIAALGWKVSIISSNYISLLLILTMSICIHLIVRYRELSLQVSNKDELIRQTLRTMLKPCFYTTLTTVIAFLSLTFSDIQPVITFGWVMILGVSAAFVISMICFTLVLKLSPIPRANTDSIWVSNIMAAFGTFAFERRGLNLGIFTALSMVSLLGISQLSVENRFIDYFKKDTEIFKGMLEIDTKLGGTTSFDIILSAPEQDQALNETSASNNDFAEEYSEDDDFADDDFSDDDFAFEDEDSNPIEDSYWYSPSGLEELEAIHDYVNELPETGKVLSLATANKIAKQLNDNQSLSRIELLLLYNSLPIDLKAQLLDPYLSEDGNEVRITTRIIDSNKDLSRNQFVKNLRTSLNQDLKLNDQQIKFTGLMVMYNNLLQALFDSQIKTLGFVFLAILLLFIIIFRSLAQSIVAIIPNLVSALIILGFIGLIGLPLDFMTITVASIAIGIAVDDTIHYTHRFKTEFETSKNYQKATLNSHTGIGRAMYYTSFIIIAGFAILVLSNFNPSMYFGLLTGLAMFIALLCNLLLLPALINMFKPYGTEQS